MLNPPYPPPTISETIISVPAPPGCDNPAGIDGTLLPSDGTLLLVSRQSAILAPTKTKPAGTAILPDIFACIACVV